MKQNKAFYHLALLFVFGFSAQVFAQQAKPLISTEEMIAESVKLAPCKGVERIEAVKKLFAQMGAKEDEILVEKFNKDKISNVVVRKKGKSDETIIIGAHYDKTADGCGAIDNWTGIAIIAHLYKTFSQIETQKTMIFVAFDQEEIGLLGSDAMAKAIPKESRPNYCAMINFDSFGFSAPMALQNTSSSKMISLAKKLAEESKFKLSSPTIEGADADSSSFRNRDIPAITFSGLDGKWADYLHSKNDQVKKINMSSVYFGYRFGLLFTDKINSSACREFE